MASQQMWTALLLGLAAALYQYLSGRLTLDALKEHTASVLFPFIWVVCLFGVYFVIKAAIDLRQEMVAEVAAYKPSFPEYKPKRPSYLPGFLAAGMCIFVLGLFAYGSFKAAFPRTRPVPTTAPVVPALPLKPPRATPTVPKMKQLTIIFKSSPLFTPHRRNLISARMESFYAYLSQLGLAAPKEVPPIRIGNTYGGAFTFPGPIYMDSITIPQKGVDDPKAPVIAYALYCFPVIIDAYNVNRVDRNRRLRASWIFEVYFVSSFFGKRPPLGTSDIANWSGALWDIRQQEGQDFSDKLAAFTLRAFNDFSNEGGNEKLDLGTYFYNSVTAGESVVDNDFSKMIKINRILEHRGLVPNTKH